MDNIEIIKNIEKINLDKGEKLLITVDVSEAENGEEALKYLKDVESFFKKKFSDNGVIVISQNINVKGVKDHE